MTSGNEREVDPAALSMPWLLAAATRAYGRAIQRSLDDAGFGDVPPSGYRLLGALTRGGSSVQELADRLSMAKQSAARLADLLVERGYVGRQPDAADRRRVVLTLTARGAEVTEVARRAIASIDALVEGRRSPAEIAGTRATLLELAAVERERRAPSGSGDRRR